ncbi:conserved unknown protein [Ectocarpus siliculosus]|uniref:Uncharacterized protein n=1 Tax=Ectocarpus siliculosus TaxID=2880 RepID=D7G2G5_ECTSI|nr:conserved unknown protein [Ectocarpus siliculosus]|eukprot:CBJ33399.1 conserved unknown protein [Ectocarpus siliculosus]
MRGQWSNDYGILDRRRPAVQRRVEPPVDLTPFDSVRQGLADNNTVGWSLAPTSIELATKIYPHPRAIGFLSDFLHQVTGIMLDQQRAKVCTIMMDNGTFGAAADLLEQQAARLDSQARRREGVKAAAAETARRAQLAQAEARQAAQNAPSPAEGGGGGPADKEAVVARAVGAARAAGEAAEAAAAEARALAAAKGEQWLGAESLSVVLAALLECKLGTDAPVGGGGLPAVAQPGGGGGDGGGNGGSGSISPALRVAQRACRAIMKQVRVLSEEELKKESQEALGHLVRNIRHVMMFQTSPGVPYAGEKEMRENVRFHSELVLRHLRASSLPMRLWGWEQTEDLINHSHRHRWNAKVYLADPTSPGTDKDVDYYQHKSNNHNNFMPWRTGWEAASDTKLLVKGVNPPPTVTPVPSEGYLCPPREEYNTLEWELARWIVENKLSSRQTACSMTPQVFLDPFTFRLYRAYNRLNTAFASAQTAETDRGRVVGRQYFLLFGQRIEMDTPMPSFRCWDH